MSESPGSDRAFAVLNADLAARINPERSRKFDRTRLEASREILFQLSRQLWPTAVGRRISVVGSNGKGSTAWYLAALAESAQAQSDPNDKTDSGDPSPRANTIGLYTSPHLSSVLERIRLNRIPIEAATAVDGLGQLAARLPDYESFSYFEILTLLAWQLFQERRCPVQIFEAGLGGRFDATRIARSDTVVLTRIDLEHTSILGKTPQAILIEKLGIISPDCQRVFYGPQLNLRAIEIETEIQQLAPDAQIQAWKPTATYPDYLAENLAFARFIDGQLTMTVPVNPEATIAPPPGRLEMRAMSRLAAGLDEGAKHSESLPVCFDVAHNPASIVRALTDFAARADFPGFRRCEVRIGVLKDRDPALCLAAARSVGFPNVRLLSGKELAAPPKQDSDQSPDSGMAPISLETGTAGQSPAGEIAALIVLGSHRIYNYFVDLTDGAEKTDRVI